jgi:protein tyrosine phosphatase
MIRIDGAGGMRCAPRIVTQLHFLDWPDFGVPADLAMLDPLLEAMGRCRRESKLMGPTVVHCSAGIGRTGTILAIDMTVQKLRAALSGTAVGSGEKPWWALLGCKHHPLDIHALVLDLRSQRHGSVINYVRSFSRWEWRF